MEYTISNNFISATIKDFGAELCSLKRNAVNTEYIWQADENFWGRHSPILFPIVGKLIDDEYIYENKTYRMGQHGFARDNIFKLHEKKKNYICFKLEENEQILEKYPFNFELYISYRLLENSLKISYKVINNSERVMPFSIGAHPAFNWPLDNERKNDCYFKFYDTEELERFPLRKNGISNNKEIIPLCDKKLYLNKKVFKNDALVIENLKEKTILFKNDINDKFIRVEFEGFPYLGLWSKPSGAPFICIEPWHGIADFIGHNKKVEDKLGIKFLEKEGIFETSYTITI
ncbi:MAG: aldose epimerase [Arcobacter sp.]|nr:MAG: aldose epimerase [Arcobacter sp.]